MAIEEVWQGKPPQHRWAVLQGNLNSNGNLYLVLSRQLTGEKIPEFLTITLPAECLESLAKFLNQIVESRGW